VSNCVLKAELSSAKFAWYLRIAGQQIAPLGAFRRDEVCFNRGNLQQHIVGVFHPTEAVSELLEVECYREHCDDHEARRKNQGHHGGGDAQAVRYRGYPHWVSNQFFRVSRRIVADVYGTVQFART